MYRFNREAQAIDSSHSVLSAAVVGNASRSSAKVASGQAAISAASRASWRQDAQPKLSLLTWRDRAGFASALHRSVDPRTADRERRRDLLASRSRTRAPLIADHRIRRHRH